jgi:hypothetical protein
MTENEIDAAITEAEKAIQSLLTKLTNDTGIEITYVSVDTRSFANLRVEILSTTPNN